MRCIKTDLLTFSLNFETWMKVRLIFYKNWRLKNNFDGDDSNILIYRVSFPTEHSCRVRRSQSTRSSGAEWRRPFIQLSLSVTPETCRGVPQCDRSTLVLWRSSHPCATLVQPVRSEYRSAPHVIEGTLSVEFRVVCPGVVDRLNVICSFGRIAYQMSTLAMHWLTAASRPRLSKTEPM